MRSGSSLTDRVCRDATSSDPEGIWKNAQKSKIPQIQPRILISDTVYSLNPNGVHLHSVADGLRARSVDRFPEHGQRDETKQGQYAGGGNKRQRAVPTLCLRGVEDRDRRAVGR